MRVGPFPLPSLTRSPADANAWPRAALRTLASWLDAEVRAEASELLGAEVALAPGAYAVLPARELADSLAGGVCALRIEERSDARPISLVCELPNELAARLCDRVLGGDGEAAQPLGRALDALSLGALGYLAARLCAASASALRVAELLEQPAAHVNGGDGEAWLCVPAEVRIAGRGYGVLRALCSETGARALAGREPRRARREPEPPELAIALCAVAARTTLLRSQLNALGAGDVVVPERCALSPTVDGFAGTLELLAAGHPTRLFALARGRELTLCRRDERQEPDMSEGKRISTAALPAATPPLGDDVPIEVELVLARFSLTLGELRELRPGDVLDAGRELGAHVTLTAAGRAVAIGELCEVDGDIGMRVLELRRGSASEEG